MENNYGLQHERKKPLTSLERILEGPMIFLGFVWLLLLILEFILGLSDTMQIITQVIWVIFIVDFLVKFLLAPEKLKFLKVKILTVVSLVVPALRLFRVFRVFRFFKILRGSKLIKVVASLNRSMKSLNATMKRRGFAYVMILTICVILAGAAGMLTFENGAGRIENYSSVLWWSTMGNYNRWERLLAANY